jgi:hypothetical protein
MRTSPTPILITSKIHWWWLIEPITRTWAKKLKKALNGLVQNIWVKMDIEEFGVPKELKGMPLIHLIQIQEEPSPSLNKGWCVRPKSQPYLALFFLMLHGLKVNICSPILCKVIWPDLILNERGFLSFKRRSFLVHQGNKWAKNLFPKLGRII